MEEWVKYVVELMVRAREVCALLATRDGYEYQGTCHEMQCNSGAIAVVLRALLPVALVEYVGEAQGVTPR